MSEHAIRIHPADLIAEGDSLLCPPAGPAVTLAVLTHAPILFPWQESLHPAVCAAAVAGRIVRAGEAELTRVNVPCGAEVVFALLAARWPGVRFRLACDPPCGSQFPHPGYYHGYYYDNPPWRRPTG